MFVFPDAPKTPRQELEEYDEQLGARRDRSRLPILLALAGATGLTLIASVAILVVRSGRPSQQPEAVEAVAKRSEVAAEQPQQPAPVPSRKITPKVVTPARPPVTVPIVAPEVKKVPLEIAPAPHLPTVFTAPVVPPVEPPPAEAAIEVAPPPRKVPFKSDRPAKEVFSGYYLITPQKFRLYVSRMAYEKSDELEGAPLKVITDEIDRIASFFPEAMLKQMRKVAVWVEWDHVIPRSVDAYAVFYGDTGHELWSEGVDARKAGNICVLSLKLAHELRSKRNRKQNTLLHEFAHAIHFYAFGLDNAVIENAYEQAVSRELYDSVKHDDGGKKRQAYARRNRAEYFAELTCAYFDRLDYYPHDAKELKEHDSVGYELMTKAYGTPAQIAAAKKKEAKAAPAPLEIRPKRP